MKINSKWLLITSFSYIYIPIIGFLVRWTNLPTAAVCLLAGLLSLRHIYLHNRDCGKARSFYVDPLIFICAILMFVWVGYYAGWGRFVNQMWDWNKHNAVLSDLVNRKWPVYYKNGDEHSMLVYYVGQYIIPAYIGKLLRSFRAAEIAVYVWNEVGMILVFLNVLDYLKTKNYFGQFLVLLLIPFFSIPLWLSHLLLKHFTGINYFNRLTNWYYSEDFMFMQYTGNFILLKWVFPQSFPVWLLTTLWLKNRKRIEYYIPMLLPAILFASFGFLGLVVLAFGGALEILIKEKNFTQWLKRIFSFENLSILLTMGTVFLAYYSGNIFSEKPELAGFSLMPYTKDTIIVYFILLVVDVLSYAVIFFNDHKKEGAYYAVFLTLAILPLVRMGIYNDLMMRASIPMLFIIMLYTIEYLLKHVPSVDFSKPIAATKKAAVCVLVVFLLLGAYYQFGDFSETILFERYDILGDEIRLTKSMEEFANRNLDEENIDLLYNYYAYDIEENIFYKLFARQKWRD